MALSHPAIRFSLFLEGEKTLDLPRGSMEERIRDLWGEKKAAGLVPVQHESGGVSLKGLISKPTLGSRSRDDQFLFLNRRYFVHKSLIHAVYSAYQPRLGPDENPMFVLFHDMDPSRFDVNVHPTKIEARFADERFVYETLKRALQEALRKPGSVPELQLVVGRGKSEPFFRARPAGEADEAQLSLEMQRPAEAGSVFQARRADPNAPVLWQLHNRYILSQIKSGLTIIDQHVAHERILYEKALKSIESRAGSSQQLLFPHTVQLSGEDYLALTEILPTLEKIGFGLKDFGGNTVVIEAVPVDVRPGREKEVVFELIEEFKESRQGSLNVSDVVAKAYAGKSAVKSGDRLTLSEMASLIDQLFATADPYVCPHGRPIVVNLPLDEIDKRFGR
jgi:DNA mismatch repair protein MutL